MTREQINAYIKDNTGSFPEFKEVNDTLFIKWDYLPFPLRDYIHNLKNYDPNKMINMERDCQCGKAYFYDAKLFYEYLENWVPKNK